ncbi:hypothetical protein SNL152K_591 [Streptomyces sp. NL15-2K]|nr:hypothetical protein SNL152K_591 [Streptomyces sp. NL15-2K]
MPEPCGHRREHVVAAPVQHDGRIRCLPMHASPRLTELHAIDRARETDVLVTVGNIERITDHAFSRGHRDIVLSVGFFNLAAGLISCVWKEGKPLVGGFSATSNPFARSST